MSEWKKTGERTGYEDPWLKVRVDEVIDPAGAETTYAVVEKHNQVGVVLVNNEGKIYVQNEFKYAAGKDLLVIPAGGCNYNEDPLDCAKRELLEETGYSAASWTKLGNFFTSSGLTDEFAHIFLAKDVTSEGNQNLDSTELIRDQYWMDAKELYQMLKNGELEDSYILIGLALARQHLLT